MEAAFSGMSPWEINRDFTEIATPLGALDLHNDASLVGFRFSGHPLSSLLIDFSDGRGRPFSLEFKNVGELTVRQGGVASDGWPEIPEDAECEGLDNVSYYEYGTDLPPVFDISSLNLDMKFRSGEVRFIQPTE
ncbi:hypothetical protein [Kitasatospora sp. NPDC089509]|uniref:hypothetical protein n=1 Tax=Kitasatospora sp. NPDC089509 TaxID=3364079 RepID=UPI003800C7BE